MQAVQTAEALDRKFKIVAELAPGAQSASLLIAADWLPKPCEHKIWGFSVGDVSVR